MGANRDYILNRIPHIAALMVESIDAAISGADVLVIGNSDPEFRSVPDRLKKGQSIVDLVRVNAALSSNGSYDGICW
jgi:GDP-mannose 6-dehydrogenase